MLGHYLLTALLNARRAPFTTTAKVLSLALGLTAAVAAIGMAAWLNEADLSLVPPGDQAVTITTTASLKTRNATVTMQMLHAPRILAGYLKSDAPGLKAVARFEDNGDTLAQAGDRRAVLNGADADPELLDIFRFPFKAGNPKTALRQANGVILTDEAAHQLFGSQPALGRNFLLAGKTVVVTGVLASIPKPSQFNFDLLAPSPAETLDPRYWYALTGETYGLLPRKGGLTPTRLNDILSGILARNVPADLKKMGEARMTAMPANQLLSRQLDKTLFGEIGGAASVVGVILGLGLVVLGVGCINYANLAAAQVTVKIAETGMRRALGADGRSLLMQSWTEAGLAVAAALSLALVILFLLNPAIRAETTIDALAGLAHDRIALAVTALIVVAASLAAAAYPALIMSHARPADALRGGSAPRGTGLVERVLIGAQFASASALLIAMLVTLQQNGHVRQLALGHRGDPVVILPSQKRTGISLDAWRVRLTGVREVKAISELDHTPWGRGETTLMLGANRDGPEPIASVLRIGFDYFDLYGQKLLAGRVFTRDRDGAAPGATQSVWSGADTSREQNIVVDDVFLRLRGYPSPQAAVGQPVYSGGPGPTYRIIGVVAARPHQIQGSGKAGTGYGLAPGEIDSSPLIRLDASRVDGGLAAIRQAWRDLGAAGAPSIKFEDQAFEDSFQTFQRIARLFMTLALAAFAIAAAGLFGMAVHATQRRLHEIGVRKTLGSTSVQVVGLLLGDFSKPVLMANLVAWPAAYLAVQAYLANFIDRMSLGLWPFIASLLITLAVAWIAVGGQTWRAASIRPAKVLRSA